jgi:hypothetical protein
MQRGYRSIDELLPIEGDAAVHGWACVAAPSVAVALLASEDGTACGW